MGIEALRDELAQARTDHAKIKARLDERFADWEAENAPLIDALRDLTARVEAAEAAVREAALAAFEQSRSKSPCAGISIRSLTRFTYDPEAARQWALAYAPHALRLDAVAYGRIAKGLIELGGESRPPGEIVPGWSVSIATDLDAAKAKMAKGVSTRRRGITRLY